MVPQAPTVGFDRLVQSLGQELKPLKKDIKKVSKQQAKELADRIHRSEFILTNLSENRKIFVIALKALKLKLLSIEQIATLHILDAAIRDLYSHHSLYCYYESVNGDGDPVRNLYCIPLSDTNMIPKSLIQCFYFQKKPLLKRFFSFTNGEYSRFCTLMENKTSSEHYFYYLNVPKYGCFSPLICKVNEALKALHPLDIDQDSSEGNIEKKIFVIPSFSMFQAFIDVKATTLKRASVTLLPTYYRLEPLDYQKTKALGFIPVALYLPEKSHTKRYHYNNPHFRGKIDGWGLEGPLASIIHDIYHAARELMTKENLAKARYWLAEIARAHPNNRIRPDARKVSSFLADGEFYFCSYSKKRNTVFKKKAIAHSRKFGCIFKDYDFKNMLHPDLKDAFIKDMAQKVDFWRESFNLGREDLTKREREIYDFFADEPF